MLASWAASTLDEVTGNLAPGWPYPGIHGARRLDLPQ